MIAGYASLEKQVAGLEREVRSLMQARDIKREHRGALDIARELGISLDPWQRDLLIRNDDALILASRQAGKGMVASLLALEALLDPGSTTIIIAKAERQAKRLLRRVKALLRRLADYPPVVTDSAYALELRNGAECLALPGSEESIRGIEAVDLLLVDEAALVPDELYSAVAPMLATTSGRTVAMSTARGRRGWFFAEWDGGSETWHRTKITALDIPRIDPAWLEKTRLRLGEFWFAQEFMVEFVDTEDQFFSSEIVDRAISADVVPLTFPFTLEHVA